ncbi:hypothetical protein FVR03_01615 [Pontibacter qinzhouensis]|uniref:Uncharacterized protein n=1 Tax=Pontibacter qinzhouensis TaxID=2603253 RepID=A0A5C8KFG4_9BACT|nr:hypothetical protein [Pontibacter qinzhouensis]TXK52145.1 hypothetical protein FVR03_01615 [Pontibacter qinzhouensis]
MKPLYYLFLFLLLINCSVDRSIERATKNRERAEKTQDRLKEQHEELVAEKFKAWYPATETETVIRDTVRVTETVHVPVPAPKDTLAQQVAPVPAKVIRVKSEVKCPEVAFYNETIAALKQTTEARTAALEVANKRYKALQQTLSKEQLAHRFLIQELEKEQKISTAWIWFNVFLGLTIAMFVVGKIFRLF